MSRHLPHHPPRSEARSSRRETLRQRRRGLPPSPVNVPPKAHAVRWFIGALFVLLCLVLFLATVVLGLIGWRWRVENRVLPGVTVLGEPIGGLAQDEAAAFLAESWANRQVVVSDGRLSRTVSPEILGFMLDAEQTAAVAAGWTRSNDFPLVAEFWLNGAQVPPVWYHDTVVTEQFLVELTPQFTVQPIDAGVQFVDGQLVSTPASAGLTIDHTTTANALQTQAVDVLLGGNFQLQMQPLLPHISDTASIVETANGRLGVTLPINLFDPISGNRLEWSIPPAEWANWLSLQSGSSVANEVTWTVDSTGVRAFVDRQMPSLSPTGYIDHDDIIRAIQQMVKDQIAGRPVERPTLRVYHGEQIHVVQQGETMASIARAYGMPYPWLQDRNPGIDTLAIGQQLRIPSPDLFLPLPVVTNKRIIVNIARQELRAYEDDALKWEWVISTGIPESPTSPGVFQVQSHEPNAYAGNWDLWMPNFMGIYQPVPQSDFMNGFHGFPTRNGSNLLWTSNLGTPVTYGCILVGNNHIDLLYEWAEAGVVVEIQP